MQVLIAEDDPISRKLLEVNLEREGYTVVAAADGGEAWDLMSAAGAPQLAVLDWMMPVLDGVEVCRRIRSQERTGYVYVILLTAKGGRKDRAEGFRAGADDYLTKPIDVKEVRARVAVGKRIIELQSALEARVNQLREALGHVKQLQGLLPICMHCKRIRDDDDTWHQIESYISQHSNAAFTHSLCADCLSLHYPGLARSVKDVL